MSAFNGISTIQCNPAHLERLSDEDVLRDALRQYRRTIPGGTAEFYIHPSDMAEYRRRADVAEGILADMD